ncbi:MAG: hypothetical protein AAFX85_06660 [Pseudomonadota bacterium]
MYLLDKHGLEGSPPLSVLSNQAASERLKTPVAKIKKLRYEAALKFGGRVEDQAMGRLLAAVANASLEVEGSKIHLVIEDALAKNWLQGQLKAHQQIFDYSFNTEIVKVSAEGLFSVLETAFAKAEIAKLRKAYEQARETEDRQEMKRLFAEGAKNFALGAAKKAGGGVVAVLKAALGVM